MNHNRILDLLYGQEDIADFERLDPGRTLILEYGAPYGSEMNVVCIHSPPPLSAVQTLIVISQRNGAGS